MNQKLSVLNRSRLIYGLVLLILFGLALFIRVYPRWEQVFGSGWVKFGEVDPWYHVRLLENLLQHFPHQIAFDPYSYFPYGQSVQFAPFFDLMMGIVAWVLGAGSPSTHTIEVVAACFPAVLGALMIIPVFFIGRELVNSRVGAVSAALVAVLPGNYLARSLLGVTDHHIAEVFLSTISALFLVLAVKNSRSWIGFRDIRALNWKSLKKPLLFAALSGFFLGTYIATWVGGLLFVLIILIYAFLQFIINHLQGQESGYLVVVLLPVFWVALIMVVPFLGRGGLSAMHPVILALGSFAVLLLGVLDWFLEHRRQRKFIYPLISSAAVAAAIGIVYLAAPDLFHNLLNRVTFIFTPAAHTQTISEAQPLFTDFSWANLTENRAWAFFSTGFFIAPLALLLIGWACWRRFRPELLFFLCWTVVSLAAMLGQNRFAYYFAVNMALLGGYFAWSLYGWLLFVAGKFRNPAPPPPRVPAKRKSAAGRQVPPVPQFAHSRFRTALAAGIAVVGGFFLLFFPNFSQAAEISRVETGPSQDWHDTLIWMRENTPEPFGDPAYFDRLYVTPADGESYPYPDSAYSVMSAWDYGHWITTIAQRIPVSNPHQFGADTSAKFLTAQDEASAAQILDRVGSRYVIIDAQMVTTLYMSFVEWAEQDTSVFGETVYQADQNGNIEPLVLFYPEYYRSMAVRLYNFQGESYTPRDSTWVVSLTNRRNPEGQAYKLINFSEQFAEYSAAEQYCRENPDCRIVGSNPFVSPVPLEKLEHYRQVYASATAIPVQTLYNQSLVEVFEYQP